MTRDGDRAPDFTAPLANGDVEVFTLSDHLETEAPVVLAFFPGAFTSVCTDEMETFQERLDDLDATLYGVSVDTPFALNAFRDDLGVDFGMLSDNNRKLIEAYDVAMDFDHIGLDDVAKRAVFVVDGDGIVTWSWVAPEPGIEPDYDDVVEATENAA
ncbi:redoxin domain-containing protein [Halobacteriales archaeon Cl-PHB]